MGSAFRRVSQPVWPFVFRGLLPVLGLLLVALFGVTRFASHWIEDQVTVNVAEALAESGQGWADLRVSGQRAYLSGQPPMSGAGDAALRTAREATCPTWLGRRVCATSVEGDFAAVAAAAVNTATTPDVEAPAEEAIAACEGALQDLLSGERIEFASGSATIRASTEPLLDRLAAGVRECPGIVRVEGHTDSTGNAEGNLALSQARADAVRAALGTRGISLDRLVAVGYGQSDPIAGNDTAAGRARNRRIEFRVQTPAN